MAKEAIETLIEEENELIALRVPPGDNWELVIDEGSTIEGLVMALTMYMRKTKFKGIEINLNNALKEVLINRVDLIIYIESFIK